MDTVGTSIKLKGLDSKRLTFGLNNLAMYSNIVKWRFSDLIALGFLAIMFVVGSHLKPFERQFYINDLTISHPHSKHDRVNNNKLMFFSFIFPQIIIVATSMTLTAYKSKIYVTYISSLGHLLSVLTTSIITDVLKNFIGRHRPDFLARCKPAAGTPLNTLVYAKDVCTTANRSSLEDGFRTTPSGHSSLSFAGLFYLSLFLSAQLLSNNKYSGAWRAYVSWMPTLLAIYIALSRTEDYKHHFIDVFIGSSLGIFFALWSYRRLFPSIFSATPYQPYLLLESEGNTKQEQEGEDPSYSVLQGSELSSI